MRRLLLVGMVVWILAITPGRTTAQQAPLIGTWSIHTTTANGEPGILYTQFSTNGQLHLQFLLGSGTRDLWGSYQVEPNASTLTYVLSQYSPTIFPPLLPLNVPIKVTYQFQNANNILSLSNGAETQVYVRVQ
jgi:hypothetical protein